jgi:hypothetical protein
VGSHVDCIQLTQKMVCWLNIMNTVTKSLCHRRRYISWEYERLQLLKDFLTWSHFVQVLLSPSSNSVSCSVWVSDYYVCKYNPTNRSSLVARVRAIGSDIMFMSYVWCRPRPVHRDFTLESLIWVLRGTIKVQFAFLSNCRKWTRKMISPILWEN